ncbi:MAG: YraN family protein [Methylocapsa sp.]|nr:YraN family protein [Methylocapsa sp.]
MHKLRRGHATGPQFFADGPQARRKSVEAQEGTAPASKRINERRRANFQGELAERLAALVLVLKGYRILARRYRAKGGEIDIIARRAGTVAFVEVKIRPTLDEARDSIAEVKRRRISRTARAWLASNPWAAALTWRGDAIFIAPWRLPHHEIAVIELDIG